MVALVIYSIIEEVPCVEYMNMSLAIAVVLEIAQQPWFAPQRPVQLMKVFGINTCWITQLQVWQDQKEC